MKNMSDFMKILGYGWLQRKKPFLPPQCFKIACLLLVWQYTRDADIRDMFLLISRINIAVSNCACFLI